MLLGDIVRRDAKLYGKKAGLSEEEIISLCTSSLVSFKKPKSVEFLDELPKNPAGKVLKSELKQKEWKGRERNV